MRETTNHRMRVAVVGGGPGGLMAAEFLAKGGAEVVLFEAMPSVGRKLLLAGRGGLNITHSEDLASFLSRYSCSTSIGSASIRAAIESFAPMDLLEWCESLGQATFVGSSGRVFPVELRSNKLLSAWLDRLTALGVEFRTSHRWVGFGPGDSSLRFETEKEGQIEVDADATVLSLGGASWPNVGSDGRWREILVNLGCSVTDLVASNCGYQVPWTQMFTGRFAGEPVKNVTLSVDGHSARGEFMIVDDGIEGGAVYALGTRLRETFEKSGSVGVAVDLQPDLDLVGLLERLDRSRAKESTSSVLKKAVGLSATKVGLINEVTRGAPPREHRALAGLIKALPLTLTAPQGLDRAISTAGGLALDELDENFMLKRRPGVFCAGEMLDWDAPTGGYLLQASFSTAVAAARGALKSWVQSSGSDATKGISESTGRSAPLGAEDDEL